MTIRVILFISVLLVSSVAYAQLTESERRGKAIYLRGESTSGRKITAMLNDLDVPLTHQARAAVRQPAVYLRSQRSNRHPLETLLPML